MSEEKRREENRKCKGKFEHLIGIWKSSRCSKGRDPFYLRCLRGYEDPRVSALMAMLSFLTHQWRWITLRVEWQRKVKSRELLHEPLGLPVRDLAGRFMGDGKVSPHLEDWLWEVSQLQNRI